MRGDDDRPAASAASRQPSFRPPGRARRPGANTTALRGGVCLAGAAQLAAHSPRKRAVAGSNPASGSTWAAVGLDGRRGQGAPAGARFDPGAVHQVSSRPTGRGAKNSPLRIRRAPRGGAQANSALPSRTPRLESWCHAIGEAGRYPLRRWARQHPYRGTESKTPRAVLRGRPLRARGPPARELKQRAGRYI